MKTLITASYSPYQQEGSKNSEVDALHSKLEEMKQTHTVHTTHTRSNDGTTIEDIIKMCDNDNSSLYLQCKTLQNHTQS